MRTPTRYMTIFVVGLTEPKCWTGLQGLGNLIPIGGGVQYDVSSSLTSMT